MDSSRAYIPCRVKVITVQTSSLSWWRGFQVTQGEGLSRDRETRSQIILRGHSLRAFRTFPLQTCFSLACHPDNDLQCAHLTCRPCDVCTLCNVCASVEILRKQTEEVCQSKWWIINPALSRNWVSVALSLYTDSCCCKV